MSTVVAEVGSTANNYQVLAKLAVGGMAEIFLARGASTAGVERYVVLKRILREKANDAHFVQMFLEEARLAAQLQHPNVAQVYDIGKLGDSYFFTMEYVHGETVRGILHEAHLQQREVPLACVLSVIAGTAAGLHHAHERIGVEGRPLGIVHRDVSPSNLMVSYEGGVKVVDFGVAKAENRTTETHSGTVKGKISYLSPEQCRGASVDRRSDLFSLGIVMWEMLTGDRLYKRNSDFDIMSAIVAEPPTPPSQLRANVPTEVDALVLRLLAKHPHERFQTGDDVVEAIEQLAATLQQQLSPKALGRYMRDLFGTRKEPWVEIETPEGVTVMSEPIPPGPFDAPLDGLQDLGVRQPYSDSSMAMRPSMAPSFGAQPNTPPTGSAAVRPALAANPQPLPAGVMSQQLTVHQAPTRPPSFDADDFPTVALAGSVDVAGTNPGQDVLASLPTILTGSYRIAPEPDEPPPLARPSPPMRAHPTAPPPTRAAHPTSPPTMRASPSASAPPPVRASPSASTPPPTRASPTAPPPPASPHAALPSYPPMAPPPPTMIGVAPPVAHPAMQPFPRSYVPPVVAARPAGHARLFAIIGGAIVLGAILAIVVARPDESAPPMVASTPGESTGASAPPPIDAAVVVEEVVVDARPLAMAATSPEAAADPIARAFAAASYVDVVAACKRGVREQDAEACTIAACKQAERTRARTWFARVPAAQRASTIAECKAAGLDVTARARTPGRDLKGPSADCMKDPMSCQH